MNNFNSLLQLFAAFTLSFSTLTFLDADERNWTDSTGKFQMVAELVEIKDGCILLRSKDHKIVSVPVSRLSDSDLAYLSSLENAMTDGLEIVSDQLKSVQGLHEEAKNQYEHERRWILFTHRIPTDPKLVEYEGSIYDEQEMAKITADLQERKAEINRLRDAFPTPRSAADWHIGQVREKGIIEQATYVETLSNPYLPAGNPRNHNASLVRYRVQYVSRGGILNDRMAYVILELTEGGYWYPTFETRTIGVILENIP